MKRIISLLAVVLATLSTFAKPKTDAQKLLDYWKEHPIHHDHGMKFKIQ